MTISVEPEAGHTQTRARAAYAHYYEKTVTNLLDLEISSFFIDYGCHVVCQLLGMVAVIVTRLMAIEKELLYGLEMFFGSSIVLLLVRLLRRKSDTKIKRHVVFAEILLDIMLISSILTFETQLALIPMIGYSVCMINQVVLYCVNFADSIDQTIPFKLVALFYQAVNFPKILVKLQIFLVILKLTFNLETHWIYILTPTWLVGSAVVVCLIFVFATSILKAAVYLFKRKAKDESRLPSPAMTFVLAALFLMSQTSVVLGVIIVAGVINLDPNDDKASVAGPAMWMAWMYGSAASLSLLLLTFAASHRNLR